jgi:hypothetical protein
LLAAASCGKGDQASKGQSAGYARNRHWGVLVVLLAGASRRFGT